ncbi:MAG: Fic family protein [Paludibacter sp.]|jgi:Fic family protein|nr:Fic family protein [Paludibacter sp.]
MPQKIDIYKRVELLTKEYKRLMAGQVDLEKYTYYSITYHSTVIEGSTLTESQVFDLLENDFTAKNKPFSHHLMVIDHHKALEFLLEYAEKKQPVNLQFIQKIGGMVVQNTGAQYNVAVGSFDSTKGDLRLLNVRAGSRSFPSHSKVPDLLNKLIAETQKEMQTVKTFREKCELAFRLHFRFVSIHPFADGNGRTSRLLMNYILAYFNLPVFFVFKENRRAYITALETARENENDSVFYNFMFKQYEKFLKKEITEIEG